MQTLIDHGSAIASATEQPVVLASVLRQARHLLDADLSYVSLNDSERKFTSIQAVDGVLTQQFRRISMPLGTGLLGQVAASDHPMQTSDYLKDESLVPYPENDPKVGGEHVRAILGVPIRIGNTTVGALLVADRDSHEFTPHQVDLLQALATQLSAFLVTKGRIERRDADIQELTAKTTRQAEELIGVQTLAEADRSFARMLVAQPDTQQLATELTEILHQRVDLVGAVADGMSSLPGRTQEMLQSKLREAAYSPDPLMVYDEALQTGSGLLQGIAVPGEVLGGILVHGDLADNETIILKRAADALCGLVLQRRSAAERETRDVEELIGYVMNPAAQMDRMAVRKRLQQFGIDIGSPLSVAVIKASGMMPAQVLPAVKRAIGPAGLVAKHADHICVLLTTHDADYARTLAAKLHSSGISAAVGIDGAEPLPDQMPRRHHIAHAVSTALVNLRRTPAGASRASLGVLGLLVGIEQSELVPQIIEETLGPVLAYDRDRGTSLTDTLEAFLDQGQHFQMTASTLHLHVNTLRQRLAKIDNLLGTEWRTPAGSFDVSASLKVRRLFLIDDLGNSNGNG
ncbi:helix-turn-helix domain-containing protein [Paenarthrobacter nicotinovorans]|uniref:helix-turn-helix domain-containing protein n=1 Tax=Paenarthrobacter nicotinovorans TaxID=29320 RepID=UPI003827CDF7